MAVRLVPVRRTDARVVAGSFSGAPERSTAGAGVRVLDVRVPVAERVVLVGAGRGSAPVCAVAAGRGCGGGAAAGAEPVAFALRVGVRPDVAGLGPGVPGLAGLSMPGRVPLAPARGDPALGADALGDPAFDDPAFGVPAFGDPAFGDPALVDPDFWDPDFDDPA